MLKWCPIVDISNECAVLAAGWMAFVGAVIGGFITYVGVRRTLNHADSVRNQDRQQILLGVYQALHTEVATLREVYETGDWGHAIENLAEGHPLASFFPVEQDYFVVYRNNTNLIGLIPEEKLRREIVATYVKMMGFIDSIRHNNWLLAQLEDARREPLLPPRTAGIEKSMVEYAVKIRNMHCVLKESSRSLLVLLEKAAQG